MRRLFGRMTDGLVVVGLQLAIAGCHHAGPGAVTTSSSFEFVEAPAPPAKPGEFSLGVGAPRDAVVDAKPIEPLATPIYPAAARAAKLGVVTFAVRLSVDPEGRVSAITPSVGNFSVPPRFLQEFQAAVEAAVAQWRFVPSEIHHFGETRDAKGGLDRRVVSREKIEASGDVVFTFTAAGEVWTGAARKTR